jgi:MoaA/NifB/PqqE/SkfB family radical SAM enzyme
VVRSSIGTIARAIADTPYGQPLRFECPLIVTVAVSDYCPFACANCYSNAGAGFRATEQEAASFEKLAVSKTPLVLLTGGEPMAAAATRPGVLRLLDAGKVVFVSTNASIEGYVDLAARHPLLIFILPIWGNRKGHDEQRGPRSFERVTQNLQRLKRVGRRGWILVVLNGTDLSALDEVMRLAEMYQISLVRITRKVRVGREDGNSPEVTTAFVRAVREAAARLKRFVPNVVVDLPETRTERGWAFITSALGIPHYRSCAAGNWMMHVDPGGNAYPCYTFEGGTAARVPVMASVADQWRLVRARRSELSDGAVCVGEAMAARVRTTARRLPVRSIDPGIADPITAAVPSDVET